MLHQAVRSLLGFVRRSSEKNVLAIKKKKRMSEFSFDLIIFLLLLQPHRVKTVSRGSRETWESKETGYESAKRKEEKKI